MEITKSHWLHWYFPAMTPWKPYSRNYDQSWEPSAGSLIRTPWWSFLSWEKFGQNKSQALPTASRTRVSYTGRRGGALVVEFELDALAAGDVLDRHLAERRRPVGLVFH